MDHWMDFSARPIVFAKNEEERVAGCAEYCASLDSFLRVTTHRMANEGWCCSAGNKLTCSAVAINTLYTNMAKNENCKERVEISAVFAKYPILDGMFAEMHKRICCYLAKRAPKPY